MLHDYLRDLKCVEWNHEIFSNMKVGITEHLTSPRKSNLVISKEIMYMLASNSSNGNSRGVARILGVDKRNIRKALGRQVQLDTMKDVFWITRRRAKRSNALPQSLKDLVIQYWTNQTNCKDVVRHCIGVKVYEEHAAHYLQIVLWLLYPSLVISAVLVLCNF
jgi:hypothetical protein